MAAAKASENAALFPVSPSPDPASQSLAAAKICVVSLLTPHTPERKKGARAVMKISSLVS